MFRSGGFAKDAIYLRGFKAVLDLLAAGASLDPFWLRQDRARAIVAASRSCCSAASLQPPALHARIPRRARRAARIAAIARQGLRSTALLAGA